MRRPTRLLTPVLALALWTASARADLIPIFSQQEPELTPAEFRYDFDVAFFGPLLTAGDSLTLLAVPGPATGAAPGVPFDVSTAPTAGDPRYTDVTFAYTGPDVTSNWAFLAPGPDLYSFHLFSAARFDYDHPLYFRSYTGPLPDPGPRFEPPYIAVVPIPAPEPASLALMGAGGLALAGLAWRRRRAA